MTLKTFSGRRASQNEYELKSFISLLNDYKVSRYLEIGAREGDTFVEIIKNLKQDKIYGVAVDLPGGLWGKSTTREGLNKAIKHLTGNDYKVSHLFGDSQTEATKRLVVGRGPYDAILIDGDHTLSGVSRDFELYKDIAPIIAFHDIVGTGEKCGASGSLVEVPIFWKSLKEKLYNDYKIYEFIDKNSRMGIGVLVKNNFKKE